MFLIKQMIIICLLAYKVIRFECNVCKKSQTSNNCTPSNSKYVKLSKFNDFILNSSFLLSSSDSNSNLKCFASCSTNDQCVFLVFKQKKCYFCNKNIIGFMSFNSTGNSLIYQKSDSKFILSLKHFYFFKF